MDTESPEPSFPPRIPLGAALPDLSHLPTLDLPTLAPATPLPSAPRHSQLAAGWRFEGQVTLEGSLTVAGELHGRVHTPGSEGHVTIAETGHLQGELQARSLSVLGRAESDLDVSGGRAALHASAVVSGRLRYGQLQVNGAELNAQVERVSAAPAAPRPSRTPASRGRPAAPAGEGRFWGGGDWG